MINDTPYLRLMSCLRAISGDDGSKNSMQLFMKYADLLGVVCDYNKAGRLITMSTLVYTEQLGTYKSVYKRVKQLEALGYIELMLGEDKRVRLVKLSTKGEALVVKFSEAILDAGGLPHLLNTVP